MSKKIQITAEEFNRDPAAAIRASRELVVEITQDGEVTTTLHRPQNRILSEDDLHERIEKAKKVAQEVLADPEPESTGVKMAKWIARRKVALDVLRALGDSHA